MPKKSLILRFPTSYQVPCKWLKDFIRGYFDGDGSLWKSGRYIEVSILSSYYFLEGVKENVKEFALAKIIPIHKELPFGGQRITVGGKKGIEFLDWIYKDATIYLDRKYNKYLTLCHPYQ